MPHEADCHRLGLQASGFREQSSYGIRGWRAACRLLGAASKEKKERAMTRTLSDQLKAPKSSKAEASATTPTPHAMGKKGPLEQASLQWAVQRLHLKGLHA